MAVPLGTVDLNIIGNPCRLLYDSILVHKNFPGYTHTTTAQSEHVYCSDTQYTYCTIHTIHIYTDITHAQHTHTHTPVTQNAHIAFCIYPVSLVIGRI